MKLGAWSAILLVLAVELALIAIALTMTRTNRLANLYLAALLVVLAGLLTPFVLGYAGAYDAWPWLSFAPFAVPLAVGPLLFGHIHALVRGRAIARWHFVLPAIQFGYQAALFPTSMGTKNWFDTMLVEPWIGPVLSAAVLVSMAAYGMRSWTELKAYEQWLAARRRQDRPARRIRFGILLLAPLVAARAAYSLFEALVRPVNYFDLFGYYLLIGAIGVVMGVEAWRHAEAPAPTADENVEGQWRARGAAWIARLSEEGWWREPELDAPALAKRLGTNVAHLSRGLAPAGGFAVVIGNLRAEAVAAWIDAGRKEDLLALAMDAGFGSKASFNRSFAKRFGISPSAYRTNAASAATSAMLGD